MNKQLQLKMKYKGLKIGTIFLVLSILLTLTIIGPVFIPIFAEIIGKSIDKLLNEYFKHQK